MSRYKSDDFEENILGDEENVYIPNIYVDERLIKNSRLNIGHFIAKKSNLFSEETNTIYVVNGTTFCERKTINEEVMEFAFGEGFELNNPETSDEISFASNMELPEDKGETASLIMTIEKAPNGVIVNSNVFLTQQQWHTIVNVDERTVQCAVCAVFCKIDEQHDHIHSEKHLKNLERHLPLDKHDLCIMRKINDKYHCGVCSELFDIDNLNEHFSTKSHEDKLLFAINRVSDIMYDLDIYNDRIEKEECYHFNARSVNNMNHVKEDISDDESSEGFYDDYWTEKRHSPDYENQSTDECVSEIGEEIPKQSSYATMARKPRSMPKFLEMQIRGKKVRVRFDSWHMVFNTKFNKFYCMVCKLEDHNKSKFIHCNGDKHLERLKNCTIVEKYDGYLVRKVDHKLYHCAHCNNLQLIDVMNDHLETAHPRKTNKNITEGYRNTPPLTKINKNEKRNAVKPEQTTKNGNNETKSFAHVTDHNRNNLVYYSNRIEYKMKELNIFCMKFTLSLLSYNMVLSLNGFHCCACELSSDAEEIARHIEDVHHVENLMRTPFLYEFNYNLIRAIRNGLHCSICNIPVSYGLINAHIVDPVHVGLLNKAITLSPATQLIKDPVENQPSTSRKPSLKTQGHDNQFSILGEDRRNRTENDSEDIVEAADFVLEGNIKTQGHDNQFSILGENTQNNTENDSENIVQATDVVLEENKEEIQKGTAKKVTANACIENANKIDTEDEENTLMDTEEFVYLKLNNIFIRVSITSYNTLIQIGDGSRYCFLCSTSVQFEKLKKHVDSRQHTENVCKYKFVDKYSKHVLRQVYLNYHCGMCNVSFPSQDLNTHLSWPVHLQQSQNCRKIDKKTRKLEAKNGIKQINISLQKETIYLEKVESKIEIVLNLEFAQDMQNQVFRKSKMVFCSGNVLKISWDSWHGFVKTKSGHRCCLCQEDLNMHDLSLHADNAFHVKKLEKSFLKQYIPALIRKINETTLNCVTCNAEVFNKDHIIFEHLRGKKHEKNYEIIVQDSAQASTFADCDEEVFTLE
ncbi:unnamed protein product [Parnassius apollo]|uniref:(apollo) hypothetical protein n=1 Tax=Parnassius apollo TaxID=110799 RepID=A0A8S3X3F7_PARAO|nr:unnamed protein product [Parnassius apollo]